MSRNKPSNIQAAIYIAETKGENVSEEKLTEVATKLGYRAKVLIRNYKELVKIRRILRG